MAPHAHVTFTVNGEPAEVAFAPYKTLLEVLREDLNLPGTKHGCELGDALRRLAAVGAKPVGRPIERAEKGAGGDGRFGAAAACRCDEGAHAALVAIALGDDPLAKRRRQGVDFEVSGGRFEAIDETEHVRDGELAEARRERTPILRAGRSRGDQGVEQAVQRAVLAEEQQLLLAAEVVIQVARRQVGGDGDVAHAGGVEAAGAKHSGGGAHDVDAARLGAFRTAVRKVNHGSIVAEPVDVARLKPSRSTRPIPAGNANTSRMEREGFSRASGRKEVVCWRSSR